jgi:hypothetical protein
MTVWEMLDTDNREGALMTESDVTIIEVPEDNGEAVRRLRAELRAAKRRLSEERRDAMFAGYRLLWLGGINVNGRQQ